MARRVVLVGGGHSHVQVLRRWIMAPPEDAQVTLVVDRPVAVYSGMVPALVAGEIARHELEIDVRPLARRGGVRVVDAAATRIDPVRRRVHVAGRAPLPYDLCSLDVGSTVAGADLPGVREHAVPTRPIADFIARVEGALSGLSDHHPPRVVVVGAGAGGVELAACLEARLAPRSPQVTLVSGSGGVLPGAARGMRRRVAKALVRRGIGLTAGARVAEVRADAAVLSDGEVLPADVVVWVTGAVALPLGRRSGLPTDDGGFVLVRDSLEVVGHDGLFAVGDCARLVDHRWVPRAGVYAVRQGPVLAENLERVLSGRALRAYTPQRDFLSMLNLGDGTAVAGKWGLTVRGRWVHRWKDRIDRSFMERFQVLGPGGSPDTPFAAELPPMALGEDAPCGGCAAKVDRTRLSRLLDEALGTTGAQAMDDAARLRLGASEVVATVDGFPPFTDDPWLVGRTAAANAVRDVIAKGSRPRAALAHVQAGRDDDGDAAQLLAGVVAGLAAEGVALVGGHTGIGDGLHVSLSVLGVPGPRWWSLDGARTGDVLLLTGPLGSGVLWRADMAGLATGPWIAAWRKVAWCPVAPRVEALAGVPVRAATDVSGFGLAGHLRDLAEASAVTWVIDGELPAFPGVRDLLARGLRSTAHAANAALPVRFVGDVDPVRRALLFDPQTAGPVALAVRPEDVDAVVEAWPSAVVVGRAIPRTPSALVVEAL